MGTQLLSQKEHSLPQFSADVCSSQTVGRITMKLGAEVGGLDPGDIVLDGTPLPHPKKRGSTAPPPNFGPYLLWPNG